MEEQKRSSQTLKTELLSLITKSETQSVPLDYAMKKLKCGYHRLQNTFSDPIFVLAVKRDEKGFSYEIKINEKTYPTDHP